MSMSKDELKAQHPELYAQVIAEGVAQERDRATAHITLGREWSAMNLAVQCIVDGTDLNPSAMRKYFEAAMNARDIANRQADSDEAGAALAGVNNTLVSDGKDMGDKVADKLYPEKVASGGVHA